MYKVVLCFFAALLTTVCAANIAFQMTADTGSEPANQPWAQNSMEFVAWNDIQWTAWIRDGQFELLPQEKHPWSRHANTSLAYVDWEGNPWQAKVDGEFFLLASRGNWQGPIKRATAIRYRNWQGNNAMRTAAQLTR
jgi:hypothetical protein